MSDSSRTVHSGSQKKVQELEQRNKQFEEKIKQQNGRQFEVTDLVAKHSQAYRCTMLVVTITLQIADEVLQ